MQNLRDKLLKAGLVTEKQVEKVVTDSKRKPPPPPSRGASRPPQQARPQQQKPHVLTPEELLEEKQRSEAFAAREAELSEQRRRESAKATEARRQSERARSLRALISESRLQDTLGEVSFHFVRRSGKVGRLALAPAIAGLLEDGGAAVVEMPGETDPAILLSDAAKKAWTIDPRAIFFWAGPQKPIGFDDLPPIDAAADGDAADAAPAEDDQ